MGLRRLLRANNLLPKRLDHRAQRDLKAASKLLAIHKNLQPYAIPIHDSHSQLHQDLFVLSELSGKRNGYFVEFGAADGKTHSNSYFLEKVMGWGGILAEPARRWHSDLKACRNVSIETDCVWSETGQELNFLELSSDYGQLSTIDQFISSDFHDREREHSSKYKVKTISLLDLLNKHNAPKVIDYLSIDTEGSEFEILNSFDFDAYRFQVITCEHNFTEMRAQIHELLTSKGYVRKFESLSNWDDWYVNSANG